MACEWMKFLVSQPYCLRSGGVALPTRIEGVVASIRRARALFVRLPDTGLVQGPCPVCICRERRETWESQPFHASETGEPNDGE